MATRLSLEVQVTAVAQVSEPLGGVRIAARPAYFSPRPMEMLLWFSFTDFGATSTVTVQRAATPLWAVTTTTACPRRTPRTEPVLRFSLTQPASGELSSTA